MITASSNISNMINSPVRQIAARVELYLGSALVETFNHNDKLQNISVERVCEEGKFFGFGICQHVKVKILDKNREVNYITTAHSLRIAYGVDGDYVYPHPTFYITQSRRDENTNELTIYGYDLLYPAATRAVSDFTFTTPYTIRSFARGCATFLNASSLVVQRVGEHETCFDTEYPNGANMEGSENIRAVLDDIAEATQTIYFVDSVDNLVFKRLDGTAAADLQITKSDYFTLDSGYSRRLSGICHATELGDNVSTSIDAIGTTQYVRNNVFWEMREDIANIVDNAVAAIGGLTIGQFDCTWRGNFLLELGDKIAITTKDNLTLTSFLLDDTIEYNGALQQTTKYSYVEDDESASNDTSLGAILNQTSAKVDKVNKQIEILAGTAGLNQETLASLVINTDSINASLKKVEQTTSEAINDLNNDMATLTSKVNSTMTPEAIQLQIQTELASGVGKISTTTGYTFDEEGLSIEKTGSEMKTQITEDGMSVYRDSTKVLTANNIGVVARNLHAETYLTIGTNSRFEDYEGSRTGCFWIGG